MIDFLDAVSSLLSTQIAVGNLELPFNWWKLVGSILILIGMVLAYRLLIIAIHRLLDATLVKERTQLRVIRWTRIVLRIAYVLGFFGIIGWLFGARMFEYIGVFFGVLGEPLITSGSTNITFLTLLLTVPVFYLASWAGRASRAFLDRSLLDRMGLDASRRFSFASLVRYGVMVIVVLVGLSVLGIDLSALAVLFGVLGIGIGFGLQNVVGNFFAGLIIILSRPIKERDRILVDGFDGTVVQIRLLSTVINTVTEETIIIPNSQLVDNSIHNYSYDSRSIIVTNSVGVHYDSEIDRVIGVLEAIGRDNPFAIQNKKCVARLESFGDSGIDMILRTHIRDVDDKFNALAWNNLEIWRRFRDLGIKIPYPQVDLHLIDQQQEIRVSARGDLGGAGRDESEEDDRPTS